MSAAYFLTGTDTEIGKTFVSCALLQRARQHGLRATGLKPIAAGTDAAGHNEDVEQILAASNAGLSRSEINRYCLRAAIAPHLAAAEEGISLELAAIADDLATARARADLVIVEGAGGFRVPLGVDRNGRHQDSADLASILALPVIFVVGMRLGCINHSLLSVEAIQARGLNLAGWVANQIDPNMSRFAENLAYLEQAMPAPLLGVIPYLPDADSASAADYLQLPTTSQLATPLPAMPGSQG